MDTKGKDNPAFTSIDKMKEDSKPNGSQMVNNVNGYPAHDTRRRSTLKRLSDPDLRNSILYDDENKRTVKKIQDYFKNFANEDGSIPRVNFMLAIGDKKKSFLAERFFDSLDTDHSGTLDMDELTTGALRLMAGSLQDRVEFIFSLYDESGDGKIEFEELKQVLNSSTTESNMHMSEKNLVSLTKTFFEEVDKDGDGQIEVDEMYEFLAKNPSLIMKITSESISWLVPADTHKKSSKKQRVPLAIRIKNNAKLIAFVSCLLVINTVLFCINCYNYRASNWWIIFARGAGMCLDFDVSIVLLFPLKRFITMIRMSKVRTFLPLDHNIFLHKLVVYLVILFSIVHTICHIGNAVAVAETDFSLTVVEFIFTTKANIGWVAGLAPITGVVLVIVLSIMFVLSLPCIRRKGHFQVFFWSHKLYVVFYVMCILHATHFWKWFLLPGVIFIIELVTFYLYKMATVKEACILPSGVTQLVIKTRHKFKYSPGDYVYLCLPSIAKYEWHPFTISSAPELEDVFWVHIRAAGSWTNNLRKYFSCDGVKEFVGTFRWINSRESIVEIDSKENNFIRGNDSGFNIRNSMRKRAITRKTNEEILITGPFGTPCREIFATEHPILVAGGIGVTPFAAILQSIFFKLKKNTLSCPECNHRWTQNEASRKNNIREVDFVWVNRGSQSFEWFAEMLFQLEQEYRDLDLHNTFHMHLFMTGAHKVQELRGLGIQVALEVKYQKTKTDFLTGLGTKTKAGRPNFDQLFGEIESRSAYRKKVFMCGSPAMAKDVEQHCQTHGLDFSKEHF